MEELDVPIGVSPAAWVFPTSSPIAAQRAREDSNPLTFGSVAGRYAGAGKVQIAFSVDLLKWSKLRHTPLWLEVAVKPGDALRDLEQEQPPRVLYAGIRGRPLIQLTLPLHVEREAVIHDVYRQIEDVLDRTKGCLPSVKVSDPAENASGQVGLASE